MAQFLGSGIERFFNPGQQQPQGQTPRVTQVPAPDLARGPAQDEYQPPQTWENHDQRVHRTLYNSEAYYGYSVGWWPKGTYAGQIRLEPGVWPKYSNPPFSNPWIPTAGSEGCGPTRKCPWSASDNSGVIVMQNGIPTRRGMCYRGSNGLGVCDCPLGQQAIGGTCVGESLRDATGQVVFSNSQLTAPVNDPYQYSQGLWNLYQ